MMALLNPEHECEIDSTFFAHFAEILIDLRVGLGND
jgi:hypothetical protein